MVDGVDKLKELLFQQEAATLSELEQRIARVAEAELEARSQIAGGLHQLEEIRRLGEASRDLHDRLEQRFTDLNTRTGTPEALRSSVAQVLDEAIVEARQAKQEDLSRALAPMLVKTIKAELRNNQAEMVEALYPITGQLVRAYVASAMRDLTKQLNRGLQSNGFMIRLRSLFSGYSVAELRLAEAQRLEVEELFLIRRGSGELICRFPEKLHRSNSDAHMSGVLAAINDFAATAFEGEGGHLRAFQLDDFTLFLRASPAYLLAARCRGVAAPGVEGLIDTAFLDTVTRFHDVDTPDSDPTGPIRLLAGLKSQIEAGIGRRHDELSSAGLPFSPLRALTALTIMALLAAGGWFAWITWEVERTRAATREAIASTVAMSGYPTTIEVGSRGRSVAISGLAPSEAARSQVMAAIATALPGVTVEDRGLAALPTQPPDLSSSLAVVSEDLRSTEARLSGEVAAVAARVAAIRIPEPTPAQRLRTFVERNAVFFANDDEYRDPAKVRALLDEVANLAKEARVLVRVVGYTDERGSQTRNSPLAQTRADKVAQELVSRGVPRNLIVTVGRATGPDLSPATGPESANRRTEFEVGFEGEPGAVP